MFANKTPFLLFRRVTLMGVALLAIHFLILVPQEGYAARPEIAGATELPGNLPSWEISESPHYPELKRTYGTGVRYERAKIKYLLGHTRKVGYLFNRNGLVYDGKMTAEHLQKKYRKALATIRTAQQFIANIATKSSVSGKHYLALPGDGRAYRTHGILEFELKRLEAFMDDAMTAKAKEIA